MEIDTVENQFGTDMALVHDITLKVHLTDMGAV